ncbi:MAG TPA: fatty acid desaturase [Polyangia bacterium]
MSLRSLSSYVREVRPSLPAEAFDPVPSRLAWLALHLAVIAAGIVAIYHRWGGWWAMPGYALLIGHSFAGAAFVGHETMHGAVIRNRAARTFVGWLCFLPFTLSPRLWVAWHNKTHHAHTMDEANDPDCFPSLATYRKSRVARIADHFSFATNRRWGFLTLCLGFTGQSTQMLWRWSRTSDALTRRERRLAIFETVAGWAVWAAILALLGPARFAFAFVLPLVIGNLIVISYILTNHSLSPMTAINDPLVNSLSVTVPRVFEMLHLNFGLHVEHHLFPSMSSRYAPQVRDELVRRWPERYQSLPLFTALARLAATPRIYATDELLRDPRTGVEAPTLAPRPVGAPANDAAPAPAIAPIVAVAPVAV